MAGAIAFLAAMPYVPFLRSAFRFALLSLQELGFAIAAGFATLILLAGIKRFRFNSRNGRALHLSGRSDKTGQLARATTLAVTLPSITCSSPVRPCVDITIRSAFSSEAFRTISRYGTPTSTTS